jgi:hypothetical protein
MVNFVSADTQDWVLVALPHMASEEGKQTAAGDQHPADHPNTAANALVILSTAVTSGLGGLYATTHSIALTALVAGLIALLGTCVLLRRRPHP